MPLTDGLSHVDFQRVWCSLEKCLLFYETDKTSEPVGKLEKTDVVSLGVNRMDPLASPGSSERYGRIWHISFFTPSLFNVSLQLIPAEA